MLISNIKRIRARAIRRNWNWKPLGNHSHACALGDKFDQVLNFGGGKAVFCHVSKVRLHSSGSITGRVVTGKKTYKVMLKDVSNRVWSVTG